MGIFGGLAKVGKGLVRGATSGIRQTAKVAGTALETGGKVLNEVAEGDLRGAGSAIVEGGKKQIGNVAGYITEPIGAAVDVAKGTGEFLAGGAKLIGTPIKGAARIAFAPVQTAAKVVGTGLETSGAVLNNVAEGDFRGAGSAIADGARQQVGNVGGYFGQLGKGASEVLSPFAPVGRLAQRGWDNGFEVARNGVNAGGQLIGRGVNGFQDYTQSQVDMYRNGFQQVGNGLNNAGNAFVGYVQDQGQQAWNDVQTVGRGIQTGTRYAGMALETSGQALQHAAG